MRSAYPRKFMFILAAIAICLLQLLAIGESSSVSGQSQDNPGSIRYVRSLETSELGILNPAGLSFSPAANTFNVISGRRSTEPAPLETELYQLSPYEDLGSSIHIATQIENPINTAFDGEGNRLLIFNASTNQLIEVQAGSDGVLLPDTLTYHELLGIDLQNPQGMTVDTDSGHLYILDAVGPSLVRIEPDAGGSFDSVVVSQIDLALPADHNARGLAYDPTTENLHLLSVVEENMYEVTVDGQIVAVRDMADFDFHNPQGMVFVPSGDLTDDPGEMSLYIADSGVDTDPADGDVPPETSLEFQIHLPLVVGGTDTSETGIIDEAILAAGTIGWEQGRILELSFADVGMSIAEVAAAAASTFQSSLVQTIDASQWSPSSPDSAGITYLSASDRLLVSDSEVNEMSIFTGQNLFRTDRYGNLSNANDSSSSTTCFSNEPTGVTVNPDPGNGHLFFSDDNAKRITEVDLGVDGIICTSDDTITDFKTSDFSSYDPEGVVFVNGDLFIVDGVNAEVYHVMPGNNGILDGVAPNGDDEVTHFDTKAFGITDPEGITYRPDNDHLYIVGNRPTDIVLEVTTAGSFVRTIDISTAVATKPAGLAYAPSSANPDKMNIFIVDRGVDNNENSSENDGKIYEMTLPLDTPQPPVANDDIASTPADTSVTIDVTANDTDPNANLAPETANATCANGSSNCSGPSNGSLENNGDGTFTYTPNSGFSTLDTFVYEVCDSGGLCDTASVTIDVGVFTIEVRVAAAADDAEERESGWVTTRSSDLELVYDGSYQIVGMRFNEIDIPQGSAIRRAYVQFQADETSNQEPANLTIQGEDTDSALTFASSSGNISSRPKTNAAVSWNPVPWTSVGKAGPDQQTPDIASIIQEVVDRSDWSSGNSLAIIIHGNGKRTAESYNGVSAAAPLLYVEYTFTVNGAPTVSIAAPAHNSSFNEGEDVTFTATATDVEDDDAVVTASLVWTSDLDGELGTAGGFSLSSLSVGAHTITATAADSGGLTGMAQVSVTVVASGTPIVSIDGPAHNSSFNEGESITFTGSASDAEDGEITNNLLWASDLDGFIGSGTNFSRTDLSVGTHAIVATATDGDGFAGEAQITLTVNGAPTVSIVAPAHNSSFNEGESVTFTATATDVEDDDTLVTASLVWTSDLDGELGTGSGFSLSSLSVGAHTITATATDSGGRSGSAQVSLTVNGTPTVSIDGPAHNSIFNEGENITFTGSASDAEDGEITNAISWSSNLDGIIGTDGSFSRSDLSIGVHTITASVTDSSNLSGQAQIALTVRENAPTSVLEVRVFNSTDDAEESITGSVWRTDSDLELVEDGTRGAQTIGLRFNGISIPQGATIANSYIQFKADESQSGPTSLTIRGEASDNAQTFTWKSGSISARPMTTAFLPWPSVPSWITGEAGPAQQTPDLTAVIQEIVDRPGWTAGNSLVIVITGTGKRVAESYNGDQAGAPLLHIEYANP